MHDLDVHMGNMNGKGLHGFAKTEEDKVWATEQALKAAKIIELNLKELIGKHEMTTFFLNNDLLMQASGHFKDEEEEEEEAPPIKKPCIEGRLVPLCIVVGPRENAYGEWLRIKDEKRCVRGKPLKGIIGISIDDVQQTGLIYKDKDGTFGYYVHEGDLDKMSAVHIRKMDEYDENWRVNLRQTLPTGPALPANVRVYSR